MLWKLPLVGRRSTEGTRQGSHLPPASSTRKRPRGGEGPSLTAPLSQAPPGKESSFYLTMLHLLAWLSSHPAAALGGAQGDTRSPGGREPAWLQLFRRSQKPRSRHRHTHVRAHTCTCNAHPNVHSKHTHMHTCALNAHSNTHVHTCSHTPHACTHAHMHEHTPHTHIHMHARALTHTHALTLNTRFHARVCSHMHTRTPMHMHSHAHTYTSEPGSAHTHSTRMRTCSYAHIRS